MRLQVHTILAMITKLMVRVGGHGNVTTWCMSCSRMRRLEDRRRIVHSPIKWYIEDTSHVSSCKQEFPFLIEHPPYEKFVWKSTLSSCFIEIKYQLRLETCWRSCTTNVVLLGMLSSTSPMPISTKCCKLSTLIGFKFLALYYWN